MVSVTIGLAIYNGAEYLDAALASLCAQTFKDLRILVSDNASTDETPAIIEKWAAKDSRIEHYRQPQNIGGLANFQWVLNNADSPWFCFAAHDDVWSPNFIESLYKALTAKPGLVLAAPRMVTMFEGGGQDKVFPFTDPPQENSSRLSRIITFLKSAHSGWIYGLFNREVLISLLKDMQDFKHMWGYDVIITLPPMFALTATGSDEAIYYKLQTSSSDEKYRPKNSKDQLILYRDTLKKSFEFLRAAPLSRTEKTLLLPYIIKYARKVQKPKRILKFFLKELVGRS